MIALLVEDNATLSAMTAESLRQHGWQVDCEFDGESGLWRGREPHYDVIILDIVLPEPNGLSIVRQLRSEGIQTPILLLTQRDAVEDRVTGLEAGADDYLPKPFATEELLARIKALVRRRYHQADPCIRIADLSIDTAARSVHRAGREITLSPRAYAVLEVLARNKGSVVSRSEIEAHCYDDDAELSSNVVDATIYQLRRAIDSNASVSLIRTRRGIGYFLPDEAS